MSLTPDLTRLKDEIQGHARAAGLDPFETVFELVDVEELNEVAAYGGFPTRFPHWRHGMEFEHLRKTHVYGLSRIYELVINNDPAYAYLMRSNSLVMQKLVIAHVYAHVDFFRHNLWFSKTNRKMMDEMANHSTRVRRYVERYGLDRVESFLDVALSLENLIDPFAPFAPRREATPGNGAIEASPEPVRRLPSKGYMERFVNPPSFLEAQRVKAAKAVETRKRRFPPEPEKDVLGFLLEHAPLERWQRDVLEIVRQEAYYFAPQAQTKVMNEGWACVAGDTPVFTPSGLLPMAAVVAGEASAVSDGAAVRPVTDRHVIRDHPTITLRTRRGLVLTGSTNHRVLLADGTTWRRLDALRPGDPLTVRGGAGVWPSRRVALEWLPQTRPSLHEVAVRAGTSLSTVLRRRAGRPVRCAATVDAAIATYEAPGRVTTAGNGSRRNAVRIPRVMDESLAAFCGYLVGDGHISRVKRTLGLTTGDLPQARHFAALARTCFGVRPRTRRDGGRWRVGFSARTVADFLVEGLGLTHGPSARQKRVPEAILRSPWPVVRAFLRAYFDCDGYAGAQAVILSTTSDTLGAQVQLLLLNAGILSRRRRTSDGGWHLHVAGASAARYAREVGFGLARKQRALEAHVAGHCWFKVERWADEVASCEPGRADVYDLTVAETHRYAAAGLVNHNSYWHSHLLTTKVLDAPEVVDYADHHSATMSSAGGLNPYKLGMELFRDIEDRWNKGRFGPEYERCDDLDEKRTWDLGLGLGREKIFEVRKIYNDVGFIDTFLTEEFCHRHKLFVYKWNARTGRYEITDRDFGTVKEQLLRGLTNLGHPFISVEDANHANRGELLLAHRHDGVDLRLDHARDTLRNLQLVWQRPVHLRTMVEAKGKLLTFDGEHHRDQDLSE